MVMVFSVSDFLNAINAQPLHHIVYNTFRARTNTIETFRAIHQQCISLTNVLRYFRKAILLPCAKHIVELHSSTGIEIYHKSHWEQALEELDSLHFFSCLHEEKPSVEPSVLLLQRGNTRTTSWITHAKS